jgi:hypothetical protein
MDPSGSGVGAAGGGGSSVGSGSAQSSSDFVSLTMAVHSCLFHGRTDSNGAHLVLQVRKLYKYVPFRARLLLHSSHGPILTRVFFLR